jgi:hypothetical protein
VTQEQGASVTARLSPVPVEPRPCALPYGLSWRDLRIVLPGFTTPVGARSWIAYEKQGLHGGATSCILTLGYPVAGGRERTETAFLKHAVDPSKAEAARYRFLEHRGVAVPRLLTSVDTGQGEVVVLEFLPTIGVESADADELLDLVAGLNSVEEPPADLFSAAPGMPVDRFDAKVRAALALLAGDRAVQAVVDPDAWFDAYKSADNLTASMPTALNHGELAFQQVGRTRSGRVVLFDLETMAVLPRFTDVAAILEGLRVETGRDERDLFGRYLTRYRALTGTTVTPESGWHELLCVRVVSAIQSLPWLMEAAANVEVGFRPASFAHRVAADLDRLSEQA